MTKERKRGKDMEKLLVGMSNIFTSTWNNPLSIHSSPIFHTPLFTVHILHIRWGFRKWKFKSWFIVLQHMEIPCALLSLHFHDGATRNSLSSRFSSPRMLIPSLYSYFNHSPLCSRKIITVPNAYELSSVFAENMVESYQARNTRSINCQQASSLSSESFGIQSPIEEYSSISRNRW